MFQCTWFRKSTQQLTLETEKPNIPGLQPVCSSKELLSPHAGLLSQIEELAGLSKDHFERYYLTAIQNLARFVQRLPASEVHHHAGLGGMLSHTLEVCLHALKLRRTFLLSESGGAEEIALKQDSWTYAVFTAALCHDLAKVAVDQTVTIYHADSKRETWNPWHQFMDEQGLWYITEFVRNRQYRLHEKASPLLVHRIFPERGLTWLTQDQTIFAQWLACISGDLEHAKVLGEIVTQADRQSVAANLGAGESPMATVKTIPLHEKLLTALRHLLNEGQLPLNRNGAAGWIHDEYCWLVSKRTVDAIREQLIQEGHSGIPTTNGRIFDILQEHQILQSCEDKAIWNALVKGTDWQHELTLIKIPLIKIWPESHKRPEPFEGEIQPRTLNVDESNEQKSKNTESEAELDDLQGRAEPSYHFSENNNSSGSQDEPTGKLDQGFIDLNKIQSKNSPKLQVNSNNSELETDLIDFLPSVKSVTKSPSDKMTEGIESVTVKKQGNNSLYQLGDLPDQFIAWLKQGLETGSIQTNHAKARIHVVEDGVALMTPGIFQDFVKAQGQNSLTWLDVQKRILKKNWHLKDPGGLNVHAYQVAGRQKSAKVNVLLFQDIEKFFGIGPIPGPNPHLKRLTPLAKI